MNNPDYWVPCWHCDYIPDAKKVWEFLKLEDNLTLIKFGKIYLPYITSDDRLHNLEILERLIRESGDVDIMKKYNVSLEDK